MSSAQVQSQQWQWQPLSSCTWAGMAVLAMRAVGAPVLIRLIQNLLPADYEAPGGDPEGTGGCGGGHGPHGGGEGPEGRPGSLEGAAGWCCTCGLLAGFSLQLTMLAAPRAARDLRPHKGISMLASPRPLCSCPQLLDELQELTNQSQDLDVALIDKKIDQVGWAAFSRTSGSGTWR